MNASRPDPQCPEPALLKALREGQLQGPLAWRVRRHTRRCPSCRQFQAYAATAAPLPSAVQITEVDDGQPPERLSRGAIIGRYVVIDRVGEGGMGVVYAAFDPELDRKVAIKLLQSNSPEGQAWLLREAQAMARLSHPNVIPVFDVGTLGERVFVAMEFVEGQTLRQWMHPLRPVNEVLDVFLAAGKGLAAAHAAGVVHRDFKPDNVLVGDDGRVRVMDFGLARGALDLPLAPPKPAEPQGVHLFTPLTRADVLVGTPTYMSPEQHLGAPADARTDQFSFAISLYETLYGELPFQGNPDEREEATRWVVRPPPKGIGVPSRVRRVLLRAMSIRAEDRYRSLSALLDDLRPSPGPSLMPVLWAAGVFAATGLLFAGSRLLAPTATLLCRGAEASLSGVWDRPVRSQMRAAFRATGSSFAQGALSSVEVALDRYSQAWVGMRTEACEATRLRGMQSDEVMSLRMMCLDRRLSALRALTGLLTRADAAVVENAPSAAEALPDLQACADVVALKARVQPPQDAATRAQVDLQRQELDRAQALYDAGKVQEGLTKLRPVQEAAQRLRYRPLEAEALLLAGKMERLSDPLRARELLKEAAWAAEASNDDDAAVQAATALIRLATGSAEVEEARFWQRYAGAVLERKDHAPWLRADWLSAVGQLSWREGHYAEALKWLDDALALQQGRDGTDEVTLARTLSTRGLVLMELGRVTDAREAFQRALSIRERLLGAGHPETAATLNHLASTYQAQDDQVQARRYEERALAAFTQTLGAENLYTLGSVLGLAEVEMGEGRLDDAARKLEQVIAAYESRLGKSHLELSGPLMDQGELELLRRHPRAALGAFQRALEIRESSLGPNHPEVALALVGVARAKLALDAPKDALPLLERALALQHEPNASPYRISATQFALARALQQLQQDAPRARELTRAAREGFAAAHKAQDVAAVEAFISHPL